MTANELRDARVALGLLWGLGRPLRSSEMGRALGLGGRDKGQSINDYERGKTRISGPVEIAVLAMLGGFKPPWFGDVLYSKAKSLQSQERQ